MEVVKKNLKVGEEFTLKVGEDLSTGYMWKVSYDKELFDVNDEYMPDSDDPEILGSGGTRLFTVRPKRKGSGEIEFTHSCPWEAASAQKLIYNITVDEEK